MNVSTKGQAKAWPFFVPYRRLAGPGPRGIFGHARGTNA